MVYGQGSATAITNDIGITYIGVFRTIGSRRNVSHYRRVPEAVTVRLPRTTSADSHHNRATQLMPFRERLK